MNIRGLPMTKGIQILISVFFKNPLGRSPTTPCSIKRILCNLISLFKLNRRCSNIETEQTTNTNQ